MQAVMGGGLGRAYVASRWGKAWLIYKSSIRGSQYCLTKPTPFQSVPGRPKANKPPLPSLPILFAAPPRHHCGCDETQASPALPASNPPLGQTSCAGIVGRQFRERERERDREQKQRASEGFRLHVASSVCVCVTGQKVSSSFRLLARSHFVLNHHPCRHMARRVPVTHHFAHINLQHHVLHRSHPLRIVCPLAAARHGRLCLRSSVPHVPHGQWLLC